jgi:hypothetical protein
MQSQLRASALQDRKIGESEMRRWRRADILLVNLKTSYSNICCVTPYSSSHDLPDRRLSSLGIQKAKTACLQGIHSFSGDSDVFHGLKARVGWEHAHCVSKS